MLTLGVKRRSAGSADAHGNPVITHGTAGDWLVYAVAPGASEEPRDPNRDLSLIAWTVYAPASGDVPTEGDLVVVDGEDFEVAARPADWTRGPWPHPTAGVVVELRRAEG